MAYLEIQQKVDSASRSAAIAGKPTENYLYAREVNKIVNAINSLRSMISLNSSDIDTILSQSPKIELGEIEGSFLDVLNANEALPMVSPVFVTYTVDEVDYVQVFVGLAATYGESTLIFFTADDFILVYQSDEQPPTEKVYSAMLNQAGTNAPVATLQKNSFGVNPTWNYAATGNFYIQFPSNVLTAGKTLVRVSPLLGFFYLVEVSGNSVTFFTKNTSNANANGLLLNTSFEIIVQP